MGRSFWVKFLLPFWKLFICIMHSNSSLGSDWTGKKTDLFFWWFDSLGLPISFCLKFQKMSLRNHFYVMVCSRYHFSALLLFKDLAVLSVHISQGPVEKHDIRVQLILLKSIGSFSHLHWPCGRKIIMKSLDIWTGKEQTASACVFVCSGMCIRALFMHNLSDIRGIVLKCFSDVFASAVSQSVTSNHHKYMSFTYITVSHPLWHKIYVLD